MTNKSFKNLIIAFAFAIFFVGANSAMAYVPGLYEPQRVYGYTTSGAAFTEIQTTYPTYQNVEQATKTVYLEGPTNYVTSPAKTVYVEGPTNYVAAPAKTVYVESPTKYVSAPAKTVYVPTSTNTVYVQKQAETAYLPSTYSNVGQPTNNVVTTYPTTSQNSVYANENVDRYNENLAASVYDANAGSNSNLTALALNGSGGFMPSSVWQWIIVVFLILVIIIIIRIMIRKPDEIHEHHEVHTTH